MNTVEIFVNEFKKLWKYRLDNMSSFDKQTHQVILTLGIFEYYLKKNTLTAITLKNEYKFINECLKFPHCWERINNDYNIKISFFKCWEIIESYILAYELNQK